MVLWIFLEVVMVKDEKVKKKNCIGFKGFAVKSCSKTSFIVLAKLGLQISELDDSNLRWCVRLMDENV